MKRWIAILLTVLMVLSSVSLAVAAQKDVVEINYLTWRTQADRHPDFLIAAFEEQNPNIKVNFQVVKTLDEFLQAQQIRLISGTDMDVTSVRPESVKDYVEAGYLVDLTGAEFLNNYVGGSLDGITVEGKTYGVAGAINLIGIYYNADLFQKNGVKVPESYDEFIAACQTFVDKGIVPMANGCKEGWQTEFDIYTYFHDLMVRDEDIFAKIASGELKYTDEIFLDTFKKINTFYNAGYMHPDSMSLTGGDAFNLFVTQQTAMLIQGEWQATGFDDVDMEFKLDVFPMVAEHAEGTIIPLTVGNYECVVSSSAHPEEAKLFLEFMSSPEGASITSTQLSSFSPVVGSKLEGETALNLFAPMLNEEKSVDFFYSRQNSVDNSEMLRLLQEMFLDMITPEELAENLQAFHDANVN